MALTLEINVTTDDCQNLIFTETTGAYNVTTNPTGWGTPNPATSAATAAQVTVTAPSGTSYTFSVFSSSFPTTTTTQQYLINYANLGMTSGLLDGIYTIVYTVTITILGLPITSTVTQRTMIVCNLECCIDKLILDIDTTCSCSDDAKSLYLTAFTLYQQITHSIECGDLDTAEDLVDLATKICRNQDCSSCK